MTKMETCRQSIFPSYHSKNATSEGNRNCALFVALLLGFEEKRTAIVALYMHFLSWCTFNLNHMVPKT
jgi:hypothetical protein